MVTSSPSSVVGLIPSNMWVTVKCHRFYTSIQAYKVLQYTAITQLNSLCQDILEITEYWY